MWILLLCGYDPPASSTCGPVGSRIPRPLRGHWEGDTLVIDTVGFNEKFWMTRFRLPHTDALHLIERISRSDYNTLKYEATIDDPKTYTRPWSGGHLINWHPGEDFPEYFCQDNNRDTDHLVGQ